MNMHDVMSSWLAAIGYEPYAAEHQYRPGMQIGILVLRLRDGREMSYADVPVSVAREMWRAPSKGRYYGQRIRGQYWLISSTTSARSRDTDEVTVVDELSPTIVHVPAPLRSRTPTVPAMNPIRGLAA